MKEQKINEIDIVANQYPTFRLQKFYLDRLRAEGVEKVETIIDNETGILTIRPCIDAGKTGKK